MVTSCDPCFCQGFFNEMFLTSAKDLWRVFTRDSWRTWCAALEEHWCSLPPEFSPCCACSSVEVPDGLEHLFCLVSLVPSNLFVLIQKS